MNNYIEMGKGGSIGFFDCHWKRYGELQIYRGWFIIMHNSSKYIDVIWPHCVLFMFVEAFTAVRPVICVGLAFYSRILVYHYFIWSMIKRESDTSLTNLWKTVAWLHHFTKRRGFVTYNYFKSSHFVFMFMYQARNVRGLYLC